jgi:hypothetical protein
VLVLCASSSLRRYPTDDLGSSAVVPLSLAWEMMESAWQQGYPHQWKWQRATAEVRENQTCRGREIHTLQIHTLKSS